MGERQIPDADSLNPVQIQVQHLNKSFGTTAVLKDVSLSIESRELFFLLGPSGCGKTTLLRTLAGFYEPDSGEVRFGDRSVVSVPPHQRNTGMVFQNYALWPHMTVAQTVAYGLDVRGIRADEKARQVTEALATVRMQDYAQRSPNQLSGGQQQRVALARALVIRPDVLLLDEPLSNLDAQLRLEMRDEIRRIHGETRITTVYVTHDQKEALTLADRIAVMKEGRLEQLGTPREIYRNPRNRFVADFIGETHWIDGKVTQVHAAGSHISTALGVMETNRFEGLSLGVSVELGVRPEALSFGAGDQNTFPARVVRASYLGEVEQYELATDTGVLFKAQEHNPVRVRKPGESVSLTVSPESWIVLTR